MSDVSESRSCMEVHGDEEWMRDYEEMDEEDMGDKQSRGGHNQEILPDDYHQARLDYKPPYRQD